MEFPRIKIKNRKGQRRQRGDDLIIKLLGNIFEVTILPSDIQAELKYCGEFKKWNLEVSKNIELISK